MSESESDFKWPELGFLLWIVLCMAFVFFVLGAVIGDRTGRKRVLRQAVELGHAEYNPKNDTIHWKQNQPEQRAE